MSFKITLSYYSSKFLHKFLHYFCSLLCLFQFCHLYWLVVSIFKFLFQIGEKVSHCCELQAFILFPDIHWFSLHIKTYWICFSTNVSLTLILRYSLYAIKKPKTLLVSLLNIGGLVISILDLVNTTQSWLMSRILY